MKITNVRKSKQKSRRGEGGGFYGEVIIGGVKWTTLNGTTVKESLDGHKLAPQRQKRHLSALGRPGEKRVATEVIRSWGRKWSSETQAANQKKNVLRVGNKTK